MGNLLLDKRKIEKLFCGKNLTYVNDKKRNIVLIHEGIFREEPRGMVFIAMIVRTSELT